MTEERIAIVTGGGKRVGAEIVRALLARDWQVIAQVRRQGDPCPDGAIAISANLAEEDCASRIFGAAPGPVRLLVNNAARFAFDSAEAFSAAEFDSHMAVNVRAPALLASAFARQHPSGADGLIVNLLDAKLAAPNPDFFSYTISKQALAGATDLLARALTTRGIRVNAIAPALMLRSPGQSEENFRAMHQANPLQHGVSPSDVVAALDYLVEAKAVTGETIVLDGGQRFLQLTRDVQFLEG